MNMENKICVYAIAKNEIKFVDRFFQSVKEADYVCVLDTGSTDGTYERFKELGVITEQKKYETFRFDEARNDSLNLIPDDANICVCVDIDEYFESGWSKILKKNWKETTGRTRYRYTWNFNPDGSEGIVFMSDKIHKKGAFKWKYPVHEILVPIDENQYEWIDLPNIQLNHKADNEKSRSNYLPLLKLSVKENPLDDRNVHYLGREFMFHDEYENAIDMLKYHLTLPTSTWRDERCASMRYIARCYGYLGDEKNQEEYLKKAILEASHVREPYLELALLYYSQQKYLDCAVTLNEMLKIKERYLNYISSPECWTSMPYDYLSMCYYYLGEYDKAEEACIEAINLSDEKRLKENLKAIIKTKNSKKRFQIPNFVLNLS